MVSPLNPLTLQVQDLFLESRLTPALNSHLLHKMDEYFTEQMLAHSPDLPSVIKTLYRLDDDELYSVISVCGTETYEAVLMPQLQYMLKAIAKDTLNLIKSSSEDSPAMYQTIKELNRICKEVLYVLKNSTKTTRRAIGDDEKRSTFIDFPDYEILKKFYECERKVAYETLIEAQANLYKVNEAYRCQHCHRYHQGRRADSTTSPVSEEIQMSRYKTVWRRYNKI